MSKTHFDNKRLERLSQLLEKSLQVGEENRQLAIQNYKLLKYQLESIYASADMTEDAKLESEVNKSLQLVLNTSKDLDKVIDAIVKIITTQLNSESREKISETFTRSGGLIPKKPVDFDAIIQGKRQSQLEYDEEEQNDD